MEITNCEQYVLAELNKAQLEIELLNRENEQLRQGRKALEAELDAIKNSDESKLDAMVFKAGRRKLFNEGCSTYTDVADGDEVRGFEEWRSEATGKYSIPDGWKRQQFMDYFEPEYRALYEKKLAELSDGDGEGE